MVREEVTKTLERARERIESEKDHWEEFKTDLPEENPDGENVTGQIRKFLGENFSDSKLNLAFAAQQFGFSPSYLSRKFKQDTGKNFVEYLTELRMEKAIELATQGKKMFLTASEVGIPDPNYFGRCFKKYTGQSYSDYVAASAK